MERDEGKFFYCSSFIACEQAPLFGQAKRASRKCANEGPFPCLLARLALLGLRSKRFQSSYSMGSPSVPSRLKLPSIFSHPQKGTSLYIKRLPTYSEKEPSREVENFDSNKEPTVFFSVDFQSFNCYFV